MKRGDLVTVAMQGDYGKPRPALVIQADAFAAHSSVTFLPITSHLQDWPTFRLTVEPTKANGLRQASQVMIDRAGTLPREKIGQIIGRLEPRTMRAVGAALVAFLDLEDTAA